MLAFTENENFYWQSESNDQSTWMTQPWDIAVFPVAESDGFVAAKPRRDSRRNFCAKAFYALPNGHQLPYGTEWNPKASQYSLLIGLMKNICFRLSIGCPYFTSCFCNAGSWYYKIGCCSHGNGP